MPGALENGKEASVAGAEGPKTCVSDEVRERKGWYEECRTLLASAKTLTLSEMEVLRRECRLTLKKGRPGCWVENRMGLEVGAKAEA